MKKQSKIPSGVFGSQAMTARCVFVALLAVAAAGCSVVPDQGIVTSSLGNQLGYSTPTKVTTRGTQAPTQTTVKLAKATYLGRAPYICTPSGFGSTSRCFLR